MSNKKKPYYEYGENLSSSLASPAVNPALNFMNIDSEFGTSVAIFGDEVFVGIKRPNSPSNTVARGGGRVYKKQADGTFRIMQAMVPTDDGTDGSSAPNEAGCEPDSISAYRGDDGDYVLMGATKGEEAGGSADDTGVAYVFRKQTSGADAGFYTQLQKLLPPSPGAGWNYGRRTALYGKYAAVTSDGASATGVVYLYRSGSGGATHWTLDHSLHLDDSAFSGLGLVRQATEYFPSALGMYGTRLVLGAAQEDDSVGILTNSSQATNETQNTDDGVVLVMNSSSAGWGCSQVIQNTDLSTRSIIIGSSSSDPTGNRSISRGVGLLDFRTRVEIPFTGQPTAGNFITITSSDSTTKRYVFVLSTDDKAAGGAVGNDYVLLVNDEVGGSQLSGGDPNIGGVSVVIGVDANSTYNNLKNIINNGSNAHGAARFEQAATVNSSTLRIFQRGREGEGLTNIVSTIANATVPAAFTATKFDGTTPAGYNAGPGKFSISDGTNTVTYTYSNSCGRDGSGNCNSATSLFASSSWTAAQAINELVTKVNASALNITAEIDRTSTNVASFIHNDGASGEITINQIGNNDQVAAMNNAGWQSRKMKEFRFGHRIAVHGDTIAVAGGNVFSDKITGKLDRVYIYEADEIGNFTIAQTLEPEFPTFNNSSFGHEIALYEDTLVIGNGVSAGRAGSPEPVHVYCKKNNKWALSQYILPNEETDARYSNDVAVHKDIIVIASSASNAAYAYCENTGYYDSSIKTERIVDLIDKDRNTLSRSSRNHDISDILLNRQGRYGWPSWKQVRTGDHPIARMHRKENTFSRVYMGSPESIKSTNTNAITFSKSQSRYLEIDETREILATSPSLSVFTWIKHPQIQIGDPSYVIFNVNSDVLGNKFLFAIKGASPTTFYASGSLVATRGGSGWMKSSYQRVDDNQWHQVGFVYEKIDSQTAEMEFYVDGKSQGNKINIIPFDTGTNEFGTGRLLSTSDKVFIGVKGGAGTRTGYFNGQMADFAIWDKALTANEVSELVEYSSFDTKGQGKGPIDLLLHSAKDNLQAWYRMGDGKNPSTLEGDIIGTSNTNNSSNRIHNNAQDKYHATPIFSSAIVIANVESELPGNYYFDGVTTIISGSQDISTNVGTSFSLADPNTADDIYEIARSLDTSGLNGGPTFDSQRVIKNYKEPSVTKRYLPTNITIHSDSSYTPSLLKSISGGWKSGFDPRLPRFFRERENVQKVTQFDRELAWNLDNKYFEKITKNIRLSESEELGNLSEYSISYGQVNIRKTFQNDVITFANQKIIKDSLSLESLQVEFIPFYELIIDENYAENPKQI